jgi:hypothetical protein
MNDPAAEDAAIAHPEARADVFVRNRAENRRIMARINVPLVQNQSRLCCYNDYA